MPFAWLHPAVTSITETAHQITNSSGHVVMDGWLGTFPTDYWAGNWSDAGLLLIFGGIPWQVSHVGHLHRNIYMRMRMSLLISL